MSKIQKVYARQVLDSRGKPTIEVEITTNTGAFGRAIIPSGASVGQNEALELRDNNKKFYKGFSVLKAIENVNEIISKAIIGFDVTDQKGLDAKLITLDGTKNKQNLGANAILGVSIAAAKAAANELNLPLWKYFNSLSINKKVSIPIPMLNVINGGKHADNNVDFQEYMIFPLGAKNFEQALRWSAEVFYSLEVILKNNGFSTAKGDEGGFAPNMKNNEEPLKFIKQAIEKAGYELGKDFYIALDIAASEIYDSIEKTYRLANNNLTSEQLIEYYEELIDKYAIISIEDGLSEEDWEGFALLTKKLGKSIQLVGDDIFVTNKQLFQQGINKKIANAILIKPNQIGTITETIETIELAKKNDYWVIVSHRSGESEDTTIADLAVGLDTKQIKTGSLSRSERTSKYNQLLRISEEVDIFNGITIFDNII